jgi:hypothetical protein
MGIVREERRARCPAAGFSGGTPRTVFFSSSPPWGTHVHYDVDTVITQAEISSDYSVHASSHEYPLRNGNGLE